MGARRRSHQKSRRGCSSCKRRRIKCDEVAPCCGPCSQHGEMCDFSKTTHTTTVPIAPRQLGNAHRNRSSQISGETVPDPIPNVLQLELLHCYCTRVCQYLEAMDPDSNSLQVLWREHVPKLSFQVPPLPSLAYLKNPVLLHALLCLSATYLKHMHPDTRIYDESILFHKHHALSLLQTNLDLINTSPTTNDAIFGTSTLLVIQAFAEFSTSNSTTSPNLEWLPLIKGSKAVIGPMWGHRNQSIFRPILNFIPLPSITPESEQRLLHKFNLTRIVARLPSLYSTHVIQLVDIIDPLFPLHSYQSPPLHSSSNSGMVKTTITDGRLQHLFAWATHLPDSFIPRSQENDSAVLTLLAWFYAALREMYLENRDVWWLERISNYGLEDVMKFLDAENRRYQSLDNV